MSLSHEERFERIVYATQRITNEARKLPNTHQYQTLKQLCENTWYCAMRQRTNKQFWIFGGEWRNAMGEFNLFKVAFKDHLAKNTESTQTTNNDHLKWVESVEEKISPEYIINSQDHRAIIAISSACENMEYALCRYDDDFMLEYETLHKNLRSIMGEIFNIMSEDRKFLYCYLKHMIVDKCITNIYDQNCLVTKWVKRDNLHHDLRLFDDDDISWLSETWRNIQFRTLTLNQKIELILTMFAQNGRWHYQDMHKSLVQSIDKHNLETTNQTLLVDIQMVKDLCEQCIKTKKEKDSNIGWGPSCSLTGNYMVNGEVENAFL